MDHLRLHIREDPIQNIFFTELPHSHKVTVTVLFQLTKENGRRLNDCLNKVREQNSALSK